MARPRRFLRALVARIGPTTLVAASTLLLSGGLATAPAPATAATAASPVSAPERAPTTPRADRTNGAVNVPAEEDVAPLRVQITSMSKATLPARGSIKVRGTVVNRSEETWTTIRLYTFIGAELAPMTDPAALDAAMDVPFDDEVGERVLNVEGAGVIESLAPGESAPYVVKVPVDEFEFPDPDSPQEGVYWFGVHALGQGGTLPRDLVADGRARTFLPYVARRTDPVQAALVVPLVHPVLYDGDGSLADEDRWQRLLSPGGRLRDLLTLGQTGASAGVPVSWLVDPALLDAVSRLAAGNAPRSLAPTPLAPTDEPTDLPSDLPSEGGTPAPPEPEPGDEQSGGGAEPDAEPLPPSPAAVAASDWLAAAAFTFSRGEVLTLPYGDVDVAAALRIDPALLDLARAQESAVLASLEGQAQPVLAAPGGYVDAATVGAAPDDVPLLVSDRFLSAPRPAVARLDGHELIVTSSGATQGSPGPGRSVTSVGLRQRLVAEAAVRALPESEQPVGPGETAETTDPDATGDPTDGGQQGSVNGQPLVVVLPTDWDLGTAEELFDGLAPDWVSFGSLRDATRTSSAEEISSSDLVVNNRDRREVEPDTFEAARTLIDSGDTMQQVLVENTRLGARVTEQALSGLSYSLRSQQSTARTSLTLSHSWLAVRLSAVRIDAGPGVTLSGDSGTFVVTLTNKLDEAVTVSIAAQSDSELSVEAIKPLELGPDSRTSLQLNATTTTGRVHNVTLMVTDARGVPLGASDQLPIRSVLVSDVIWVIIGVGVGTLFLAVALRLRRRILAARRGGPVAT